MVKFSLKNTKPWNSVSSAIVAISMTYQIAQSVSAIVLNTLVHGHLTQVIKREYSILHRLQSTLPVPQAVYTSSETDEAVVGRAFMIMKFVPVNGP